MKWVRLLSKRAVISVLMAVLMPGICFLKTYAGELETAGDAVTEMFSQSGKEYFDEVRSLSDTEMEAYIAQFESEGKEAEKEGLEEWKSLKSGLGDFQKYEDFAVYALDNGVYIISVIGGFENAECIMTLTISNDLHTVQSVRYQAVERKAPKAGAGSVLIVCVICIAVLLFTVILISAVSKGVNGGVNGDGSH